ADAPAGKRWYFEDFYPGQEIDLGERSVTETEILAFANAFDPQSFHVDGQAAQASPYGGLIASGWHVCSRVMRQFVDEAYFGKTPLLGMNVDALWWVRPVRPGDTLTVRREIIEIRPSKSQPDRGVVRTKTT
ncbi:hypothetical protein LTR94_033720, partial [Friedmanniomyces endolithicus]